MPTPTKLQPSATITLTIQGMHCASCVSRVERFLKKVPGVTDAAVNLATNRATIAYAPSQAPLEALIAAVEKAGYAASPTQPAKLDSEEQPRHDPALVNLIAAAILTAPVLAVSMLWSARPHSLEWLFALLTAIVVFVLGREFFTGAWSALRHGGAATMDTLVALGASAAYVFSLSQLLIAPHPQVYFETAAAIVTLILTGRFLEARAKRRAAGAIGSLVALAPRTARRIGSDNGEADVPVEQIRPGDLLRARPGDKIAVDGIVAEGASTVDESLLTGESLPIEKKSGSPLIAGTINGSGTLLYRATATGENTLLAHMVRLVEQAQGSKAPVQRLADTVSGVFVPIVLAIAVVTFLGWLFVGHVSVASALTRAVAVLVIACPCALGLATPTAIMVGTGRGAALGILIKNAEALERAHKITLVVFDKTGTLTQGKPVVTDVIALTDISSGEILRLAAAVERGSEHAIGQAIIQAAPSDIAVPPAERFQSLSGQGVRAAVGGADVLVGTESFMRESGILVDSQTLQTLAHLESEGKTTVIAATTTIDNSTIVDKNSDSLIPLHSYGGARGGPNPLPIIKRLSQPIGLIAVADTLRDTTPAAIKRLRDLHIDIALLTGDSPRVANAIAHQLGITQIRAAVRPDQKAAAIQEWQNPMPTSTQVHENPTILLPSPDPVRERSAGASRHPFLRSSPFSGQGFIAGEFIPAGLHSRLFPACPSQLPTVAMVGDGVNDAPALAQADIGIAMGLAADIASEAADITLLRADLAGVPDAIALSRRTMKTIRQNLFWAFCFNVVGIPLAALGHLNPMIAALAMACSSVTVVTNSLRLKGVRL